MSYSVERRDPDSDFHHAPPLRETRLRVAVVGAGISGLASARTLLDAFWKTTGASPGEEFARENSI
jgi:hypothetical protein